MSMKVMHQMQQEIGKLKTKNTKLEKVVKAALRIKELWLPAEAPVEAVHKAEAQALYKLHDMFEQALKETE